MTPPHVTPTVRQAPHWTTQSGRSPLADYERAVTALRALTPERFAEPDVWTSPILVDLKVVPGS